MKLKKPVVIDLFAGAGGLSLGFKLAGFNVAAHIEIDRWACETLKKNFRHALIVQENIEKLDPFEIRERVGEVDVIIGGPPCQGFSLVGKGKLRSLGIAHDRRNSLYKHFIRFVHALNPKAVVMENVPAIMKHNHGITANRIQQHFEALGYRVWRLLLNAADYGVPQKRKRAFFIGIRDDGEFSLPRKTHCDPLENNNRLLTWRTAGEALSDLPALKAGENLEIGKYVLEPRTPYQHIMRQGSHGIFNHVARKYGEMDLQIFSIMTQGMKYHQLPSELKRYRDDAFKDKYKRLIDTEPSWTVMAHLQKDGYMYIHPNQNRTITVREAARLQSFPDKFIFCGPMTQQFKQVGNAVPPLLAKAVARALLRSLLKGIEPRMEAILEV